MGRLPGMRLRHRLSCLTRRIQAWRGRRPHVDEHTRRRRSQREAAQLGEARNVLRQLNEAIDTGKADRVASLVWRAARIHPRSPRLTELRARWAQKQGDVAGALRIIESLPRLTSRLRMLMILLRAQTGDQALAHLQLSDWCRRDSAPAAAHALLATWNAADGHGDARRSPVEPYDAGAQDVIALQSQVLEDIEKGVTVPARRALAELGHRHYRDPNVEAWLASLQLTDVARQQPVPVAMVDELAGQLLDNTEVIDALVAAQRLDPQPSRIELLERALQRLVYDLSDPLPIIEALADLGILSGNLDDARRWIDRGLAITPYSARLALMLNQIGDVTGYTSDENAPLAVLRRCAEAHPVYADVRRSMILRCRDTGLRQIARQEAQRWLEESPDDPSARRTMRELAA